MKIVQMLLMYLGRIIAFPFVMFWLLLAYIFFPKMLNVWNPQLIEVINMGRRDKKYQTSESVAHGYVTVLMPDSNYANEFWFRVDQPKKLHNVSRKTLRQIVKAYELRKMKVIAVSIYSPDTGYYSYCAIPPKEVIRPCFAYTESKWN